jgi:hypothetical protein
VDSLAVKRDSLYWVENRAIVLNDEELKSYARKDTIQALVDSMQRKEDNPKFKPSDLLWGGRVGSRDSSLVSFTYGGLIGALKKYNFVDGFVLGQTFGFNFTKKKNTGWRLEPSIHWATARKTLLWEADVTYNYAPKRLGQFALSGGKTSEDYSGKAGMGSLLNTLYTLDFGRNYVKLYEKQYLKLSNQLDIANGLQLQVEWETEQRQYLDNHTTFTLWGVKNKWTSNRPHYMGNLNEEYDRVNKYSLNLQYTPEYYYRMKDGKKRYLRSRFPTFAIDYQQGLGGRNNSSVFQRMELSVSQDIKAGVFSRFNYILTAGKFFNTNAFNYIDYKHFNTTGPWVSFKDWKNSYVLLPYYPFSTNRQWAQAFLNYNTDYLLLKRLPFLQGKLFTETLQAKFLHTPNKKYYTEWGYSIDLPAGIGGAGVFVSFDKTTFNSVGVQFSIPLIGILGRKSGGITISIGD